MAAIMTIDREETHKYGILDPAPGGSVAPPLVQAKGLVEKPLPKQAPSRLAIIGRYILTPDIFPLLERQQRGSGNEIQLTDAMAALMTSRPVYGFHFQGTRFDCGDKIGFQMANLALALEHAEMRERLLPFIHQQAARWRPVGDTDTVPALPREDASS